MGTLVRSGLLLNLLARACGWNISWARPPAAKRTFNSTLVNWVVHELGENILPSDLGTLFSNCLPNTLDTTVLHSPDARAGEPDSFVITGDIPALWLRDSMNQVLPYIRLLNVSIKAGKPDPDLERLLFGLVHRHASSVEIDPFANAFAWWGKNGQTGSNRGDLTYKEFEAGGGQVNAMQDPRLFERKFELDSLLSFLKLSSAMFEVLPAEAARRFHEDAAFVPAVKSVLGTLEDMQSCSSVSYSFQRQTTQPTDTLSHGVGFPCTDTGMIRTHFRPSDDAVIFAFNVPGNAMAATELSRFAPLLARLQALDAQSPLPWAAGLGPLARQLSRLEASVRAGLAAHGTMRFKGETVFAYEVDGFGNAIFMDDANVPSLLSLPFLGFVEATDPVYLATRRMVLSHNNPWYFDGLVGIRGVGGPHTGANFIWPMSLMIQAWTSSNVQEVSTLLQQLMTASAPNSLMHESFNKDTLSAFTRKWFAWANTLFGDLVLKIATHPELYRAANLSQPVDLVALVGRQPGAAIMT